MKVTLEVPVELFRKAKAMAALEGVTAKEFVIESLRMRVEMKGQTARAPKQRMSKLTLHDRLRDGCGIVNGGAGDLSYNRKHMEGFGED